MTISRKDLTALYLFKQIPPPALDALLAAAEPHTFPPGAVIFEEGAPADSALLVVRGRLEARLKEGEHHRTIGDIRPGEIVGETALLARSGRRGASVVAVEVTEALELTPELMISEASNPAIVALEKHLLGTMSRRLRRMALDIQKILQDTASDDAPKPEASPSAAASGPSLRGRLRSFFRGLQA